MRARDARMREQVGFPPTLPRRRQTVNSTNATLSVGRPIAHDLPRSGEYWPALVQNWYTVTGRPTAGPGDLSPGRAPLDHPTVLARIAAARYSRTIPPALAFLPPTRYPPCRCTARRRGDLSGLWWRCRDFAQVRLGAGRPSAPRRGLVPRSCRPSGPRGRPGRWLPRPARPRSRSSCGPAAHRGPPQSHALLADRTAARLCAAS